MTMHLPDAPWRHRPGLAELVALLNAEGDCARFVGGAVRDTLLGLPVSDVDIATTLPPEAVMPRLKDAGIKVVPTGIDHGTVTAIIGGAPVEITTLRRDVSTDGRRATIAYTDDWRQDAARRDFTINALYADPTSSAISDFFGGLADLQSRTVRFIGDARERIAEDHLRIMRYFRFLARYGGGDPDGESYTACREAANSLMALSRERIADELLKLLLVADPAPTLGMMVRGGILRAVLPEIDEAGVARLGSLTAREHRARVEPSAVRRLAALVPQDVETADQIAARLKLSNKARKRMALALTPVGPAMSLAELAYRRGVEGTVDRWLLDDARDPASLAMLREWQKPAFEVGGGALIARGLAPGPDVARALREVEEQWIAEGFPKRDRLEQIADQTVSKFQRTRQ
ncbi:poly(A) polymerase [Sphingobium fontiphilum]|uniref:Poly(A) polymerase n=1 Tax=Sphingobium fontiphilum TaxID=944425 RepID=A0A7W6DIR9_9SPHN|nr:CCA tRNA nucleotidyltransferase [Sphingobium fontiphilum]MBB3980608.1 poly(A) polymerase [Sphingobium fontiphilum]